MMTQEPDSGVSQIEQLNAQPESSAIDVGMIEKNAAISDSQCRLEVIVVLLLALLPDLFNAAIIILLQQQPHSFLYTGSHLIVRSVEVIAPVLYIISRSGESWSRFGLGRPKWLRDIVWGMLTYFFVILAHRIVLLATPLGELLSKADPLSQGSSTVFLRPAGALQIALLIAASLFNGFAEELVMRGFLIPRIEQMLRSTLLSVIVTTLLFSSYHVYQGMWGIVSSMMVGLIFGVFFASRRLLWPIVLAHAALDFVGFLNV